MEKDFEDELNKIVASPSKAAKKNRVIGAPKVAKAPVDEDLTSDSVELTEEEKASLRKEAAAEVAKPSRPQKSSC
jgi:hypothetical protein